MSSAPTPVGSERTPRSFTVWVPAATMLLVSLISYIDRNTLALLAPTILAETHLTAEQYGYIISAFSVAYTIANPVWGRWLDRIGVRWGMTIAVAFWSAASAAHSLAAGFLSFAIARAALGFNEGATFPGGLRTVVQTLPPEKRSRGTAIAYSGGSLGAIATPLLITPIAHRFGWRAAFICTGAVGLAWLLLWQAVSRRDTLRTRQERAAVPAGQRPSFRDARIWGFACAYAWGALPLALVIYGAAIFLSRRLGASQLTIGELLWIPPLGWEIGYFFWGWLADRGFAPSRLLAWAAILGLPLAAAPLSGSIPVAMAVMFVAMFAAAGPIIISVGWAARTYSTSHSGFIAGLGAGAWSLMVAVVMPVFGRLFDRGRFDLGFALAAAFPLAGYGAFRLGLAFNAAKAVSGGKTMAQPQ